MTKNKLAIGLLVGIGILGLVVRLSAGIKYDHNDFRVATINENGMLLRSVSSDRKMMNTLFVPAETEVWVPGGLGWYKSSKIGALLKQEKKMSIAPEIFFYNFGFMPDVVTYGNPEDWLTSWQVINRWGWLNYAKYRLGIELVMVRSDEIGSDLAGSLEKMNEIAQRDFSDSRLLREDIRISIYNGSKATGMAGFISRDLEWAGLTVVGIENYPETIDNCAIKYGVEVGKSFGYEVLRNIFTSCSTTEDGKLGPLEVELYFGDSFAQMLNYQSYKN